MVRSETWSGRKGQLGYLIALSCALSLVFSPIWRGCRSHFFASPYHPPDVHGQPFWLETSQWTVCDPYAEPGAFYWSKEDWHRATWTPLTTGVDTCSATPDYLALLFEANQPDTERVRRNELLRELSWLRNRTILIIGDSVDRNSLGHLGDLTASPYWPSSYADSSQRGPLADWDERGRPWTTYVEALDLRVVNGFFYGLDDNNEFSFQADWHAPGRVEERIEQLFRVFTDTLPRVPDFIQLHSGMWDLALFGRQDSIAGRSTLDPLDLDRLHWWQVRMRSVVASVRRTWPGVPIWYRQIHRIGDLFKHATEDYLAGLDNSQRAKVQNFFTDVRIHQLRAVQRAVAEEACLPIFDFNHLWEGYQNQQEKVHPNKMPGGWAYLVPMFHHVYMEAQGREHWKTPPCPNYRAYAEKLPPPVSWPYDVI